jgi:hypothetical protein
LHRSAANLGVGGELLDRPGLSDAGLADQHDHPAASPHGLVELPAQQLELGLAADEDPAGKRVERIRSRLLNLLGDGGLAGRGGQPLADLRRAPRAVVLALGEQVEDD